MTRFRLFVVALAVAGLAVVPVLLLGCGVGSGDQWPDHPGPKVVVSFAPLYCLATNVAGNDAVVRNVMTATGPHSFQPTFADAELVRKADLMFINGLGLDNNTADKLKNGSGNIALKVVDLGSPIDPKQLMEGVCYHAPKNKGPNHTHGTDPHVWLGIDQAVAMVETIRGELMVADPAHTARYGSRAAYVEKLQGLKAKGRAQLGGKTDKRLVTFHESLNYFARTFDLEIFDVVTVTPGVEPNWDQLDALIKKCEEAGVRVIAVEPQFTTQTSAKAVLTALSKGVNQAVEVEVDPLETVRAADLTPNWYERRMQDNLDALAKTLR